MTHRVPLEFGADPVDRAHDETEPMQSPSPENLEEPGFAAAPEEVDPEPDIGSQPEREAMDEVPTQTPEQRELVEAVERARDGLQSIQLLLARQDICLACSGSGHSTFDCKAQLASPEHIALGMGLLDSALTRWSPNVALWTEDITMTVDEDVTMADTDEQPTHDTRPPLPRLRPTSTAATSSTTGPASVMQPMSKARPGRSTRWNRTAAINGVVEMVYDTPSTAIELVQDREGNNEVRGVDVGEMGLPSTDDLGHYVRGNIGESVAIHPRR